MKSDQLAQLLRGAEKTYSAEELAQRIASGKRLRVKLGMDPTAPDLTLGHTVVLRKLRHFQDAGHKAVLIIGDYTAMIGDPTGRSKARPMLTREQVEANAQTYLQQAGKVLDLSPDKFEVRHNSEWLAKMSCADVIKLLSQMTIARMLERDTFAKRQAEGKEIYMHELLYPLMQARDSVEIRADVELGGTDQTFNNLCGRDLQREASQPPQIVMVMPLLIGTDGKEKMSKSMGNYIAITEPPSDMFGKIMRVPDGLMRSYFELLTDQPEAGIAHWCSPEVNPRDAKEQLAKVVISQYHSADAARAAADEFRRVHGGGGEGLPDDIPDVAVPAEAIKDGGVAPVDLIVHCLGEKSRGEARRIVAERGVKLNGVAIEDAHAPIAVKSGDILQRGKRKFVRLVLPQLQAMLRLPPISDPQRYAGLFVYDFGDHVALGYTAAEILTLRAQPQYARGIAYEVYRVDESGRMELRPVGNAILRSKEAICFLREDGTLARCDYDAIVSAAQGMPLACRAEITLARLYEFEPPNVVAIVYDAVSSNVVSQWLSRTRCAAGDRALGGTEAFEMFTRSDGMRISSCELPMEPRSSDRSLEAVLATVQEPLQR